MPERCQQPAVRSSIGSTERTGALGADCARPVRAGGAGRAGRGRLLVLDLAQRVGPRLAAICGARGTHGERRWGGSLVKGTDRRSPSPRVRSAPPLRFPRVAPDTPDLRGVSIGLIRRATRWFAARWMRRNDALHDGAGAGGLTWRRCGALASGAPAPPAQRRLVCLGGKVFCLNHRQRAAAAPSSAQSTSAW